MNTLQEMIDALEREAFEKWGRSVGMESKSEGGFDYPLGRALWQAWQARGAMQNPCRGVVRDGCNYLAACGALCNKCGERH